ncbi:MAG: N-acetyltransferase DgcN [Alphaproteobacteria bacterium]
MIEKPYVIFLGDAPDQLAAKTGQGIADWRADWCVGQIRLDGCQADTGLEDISLEQAIERGAKTLVIGVVNSGGFMPESWTLTLTAALAGGMDIANGLHTRLQDFPEIDAAATRHGRTLHNIRHSTQKFATGKGHKRAGKRVLTVGTDCSCGKKYTALALEKEMRARGWDADFRATGQTGVLIAERGVAIDAVIADFISGAVEWLAPEAAPDHWDSIEGQGSLFHAAFAGVTVGLIHGAQPDAMVLCHEPTRKHMRGLPHMPIPDLGACIPAYEQIARLTNPAARVVGISVNTQALGETDAEKYLKDTEYRYGLPATDPIRLGVGAIVDRLG